MTNFGAGAASGGQVYIVPRPDCRSGVVMVEEESPGKPQRRIRVGRNGPYLVSGSVPLMEQVIVNGEDGIPVAWREGRRFPLQKSYILCRCGSSSKKPFCDGTHAKVGFDGTENPGRRPFGVGADVYEGATLRLIDDRPLCARARFCRRGDGVWKLTERSGEPDARREAIEMTAQCPAGRLVQMDPRTGQDIEPKLPPSIGVIEDPDRREEGPLWVMGGIQVEGADGFLYERRNRVTLCRCGRSLNKPFCDGRHVKEGSPPAP